MTQPIRFGVAGLGVGRSKARLCMQTPGCELVAVADPIAERGRRAAADFGVEWYPNTDDMIARKDIDCIGVFTPTGLHGEVAMAAAAAGKHVITTKPMETTVAKCDAMIEACRKAGVVLAVDLSNRYDPDMRLVANTIREGGLGRLTLIDFRLKWLRTQEYYDQNGGWRGTWRYDGGGSMMNQGVHYIDVLYWFFGPVKSVMGKFGICGHDIETEDLAAAVLTFQNGALGVAESTTTSMPDLGTQLEIHGTKGTICIGKHTGIKWHVGGETTPPPSPEYRPTNVFDDMQMVLRGEREKPTVDGLEGRRSVEIINAIYQSGRINAPVVLDQPVS